MKDLVLTSEAFVSSLPRNQRPQLVRVAADGDGTANPLKKSRTHFGFVSSCSSSYSLARDTLNCVYATDAGGCMCNC